MSNGFGKDNRLRIDKIAATAGNVVSSIEPNTGKTGHLVTGQVVLTTDATVANRRVVLTLKDAAGDTIIDIHSGAVVPASQTAQHHEFMQGIFRETSFIGSALQIPIPMEFIVPVGGSVEISIENGVAGDSYTAAFLGFEW